MYIILLSNLDPNSETILDASYNSHTYFLIFIYLFIKNFHHLPFPSPSPHIPIFNIIKVTWNSGFYTHKVLICLSVRWQIMGVQEFKHWTPFPSLYNLSSQTVSLLVPSFLYYRVRSQYLSMDSICWTLTKYHRCL